MSADPADPEVEQPLPGGDMGRCTTAIFVATFWAGYSGLASRGTSAGAGALVHCTYSGQ